VEGAQERGKIEARARGDQIWDQICFPATATSRVCTVTSAPSALTVTTSSTRTLSSFLLTAVPSNSNPPSYDASVNSATAWAAEVAAARRRSIIARAGPRAA
jgi:hypothetical protein